MNIKDDFRNFPQKISYAKKLFSDCFATAGLPADGAKSDWSVAAEPG